MYVYGRHGVGKTALLLHLQSELQSRGAVVRYVQGEGLAAELETAATTAKLSELYATYSEVDAVLVDDVEAILSRRSPSMEAQFRHILELLRLNDSLVVFTAHDSPRWAPIEGEALRSSLQCAALAELQAPSYADRLMIVQHQLGDRSLPSSTVEYLASYRDANLFALAGALETLALRQAAGGGVTDADVEEVLSDHGVGGTRRLTIEQVKEAVASRYGCSVEDLSSDGRSQRLAAARGIAMYLGRELTTDSLSLLARAFSRDHSTVVAACHRVDERQRKDANFRSDLVELRNALVSL